MTQGASRALSGIQVSFTHWDSWTASGPHFGALYPLGGTLAQFSPAEGLFLPLDPVIRTLDVRLPDFTHSTLAGFMDGETIVALPEFMLVATISVNEAALGPTWRPPAAPWTLDEFIGAVDRYWGMHGGAPALGRDFATLRDKGAVVPPYVWVPFVLGFGGQVTDITSDAALAGLRTLVQLVAKYGAGPNGPFMLQQGPQWYGPPKGVSVQPYPRMPVVPVLPYSVWGWGIANAAAGPITPVVTAAVRFMLWLYRPEQRALLRSAGLWPVADGWSAKQPVGAFAPKDLVNMSPLALAPPGSADLLGYIAQALKAAVEDPTTLKQQLQQAVAKFDAVQASGG